MKPIHSVEVRIDSAMAVASLMRCVKEEEAFSRLCLRVYSREKFRGAPATLGNF